MQLQLLLLLVHTSSYIWRIVCHSKRLQQKCSRVVARLQCCSSAAIQTIKQFSLRLLVFRACIIKGGGSFLGLSNAEFLGRLDANVTLYNSSLFQVSILQCGIKENNASTMMLYEVINMPPCRVSKEKCTYVCSFHHHAQ